MLAVQDTLSTGALTEASRQLSAASGLSVQLLAHLDSSNQTLLDSAAQLPLHPQQPSALMTLSQSAGRGRRGRSWSVTQDSNPDAVYPAFLASIGVRCRLSVHALGTLPLRLGIAVVQQLQRWGCPAQLKWPNDIVIKTAQGSAKLGGILVETRQLDHGELAVIMGMGLNWHSAPVLADKLTACVSDTLINDSLMSDCFVSSAATRVPDALDASAALLAAMASAWHNCTDDASSGDAAAFTHDFAKVDALYGLEITAFDAAGTVQHGIAKGINAAGHLGVLLDTNRLIWLHSGEVSVRLKP